MSRRNRTRELSEFETLLLLAIHRLEDNAYGVPIQQEMERLTRKSCSFGAIYVALGGLENCGYVDSTVGRGGPGRSGKDKRYFRLTGYGEQVIPKLLLDGAL